MWDEVSRVRAANFAKAGVTKNMRYLRKHQRVVEGFIRDMLDDDDEGYRELKKVESKENKADQGTKDLARQELEYQMKLSNMMTLAEFRNKTKIHLKSLEDDDDDDDDNNEQQLQQ